MQIVHPPVRVEPLPGEMLAGLGRVKTGPRMVPMTVEGLGASPGEDDGGIPWGWIVVTILLTLAVVSIAGKKPDQPKLEPL